MRSPIWRGLQREHVACAAFNCVAHGTSNAAFVHLNYTTQTLFKSSKVLFVMIGGWCLFSRTISRSEWLAGSALFFGLVVFGLADGLSTPRFSMLGVVFTVVSLLGAAVVGNVQQRVLQDSSITADFMQRKNDLLFFQFSFSALLCAMVCLFNGEMSRGNEFLISLPASGRLNLLGFVGCSYLGMHPLVLITTNFGATSAQVATSLRKVVTFGISFIVFPKPFTLMHILGIIITIAGSWALQRLQEGNSVVPKLVVQVCNSPVSRNVRSTDARELAAV